MECKVVKKAFKTTNARKNKGRIFIVVHSCVVDKIRNIPKLDPKNTKKKCYCLFIELALFYFSDNGNML